MKNNTHKGKGLALIRIALGLLFLIPGLGKLFAPEGITGMLAGMGFPAAGLFAWILILVEVLGGLSLILGYKTRYAVWSLLIVTVVAIVTVTIPGLSAPMGMISLLFHILALAGLAGIHLDGSGAWTLERN